MHDLLPESPMMTFTQSHQASCPVYTPLVVTEMTIIMLCSRAVKQCVIIPQSNMSTPGGTMLQSAIITQTKADVFHVIMAMTVEVIIHQRGVGIHLSIITQDTTPQVHLVVRSGHTRDPH